MNLFSSSSLKLFLNKSKNMEHWPNSDTFLYNLKWQRLEKGNPISWNASWAGLVPIRFYRWNLYCVRRTVMISTTSWIGRHSLHAKNGIRIIHGGTRKITVCSSTFSGVAAKITVHVVKCTVTHCNYFSATMNYPNAVFLRVWLNWSHVTGSWAAFTVTTPN